MKYKDEMKQKMQRKTINLSRGNLCHEKKELRFRQKNGFLIKKTCSNFRNK